MADAEIPVNVMMQLADEVARKIADKYPTAITVTVGLDAKISQKVE